MATIRPATEADLAAIAAIYNEAVQTSVGTFDTKPRTVAEQRSWLAEHGPRHPVLVAEEEGRVVGWASLSKWSNRPAYADTAEVSVYVHREHRAKGLGKGLLGAIVQAGQAAGLHTVIARIAEGNGASLRLHESVGFRQIGVMREVGRKFGRLLDVYLMQIVYGDSSPQPFHYMQVTSAFGPLSIVWQEHGTMPRVHRILLPHGPAPAEVLVQRAFPGATPRSCSEMAELGEGIRLFLEGQAVDFELEQVALERRSEFQRSVLLAEHKIPRGWITTYGRIAHTLGISGAARAVGQALARNPFPIVIPCHRAIRSDGTLGGFQGGQEMKRTLLELEGVAVSTAGKVLTDRIYG